MEFLEQKSALGVISPGSLRAFWSGGSRA